MCNPPDYRSVSVHFPPVNSVPGLLHLGRRMGTLLGQLIRLNFGAPGGIFPQHLHACLREFFQAVLAELGRDPPVVVGIDTICPVAPPGFWDPDRDVEVDRAQEEEEIEEVD